ncbi:MAG TPA: hypothetical protein VFP39_05125, partial [Gemmatimonadales bacterium]|nr:hypothetical protein [Gemmatimonadales bacterium]
MLNTLEALSVIGYRLAAELRQALVQNGERRVHIVFIDDKWRGETKGRLSRAEQQETLRKSQALQLCDELRIGLAGLPVLDEFDSDHQTFPAHLADHRVALGELVQSGHEPGSHLRC